MAHLVGIVAIVGIILFVYVSAQQELYSDKYDDIDIIEILNNDKLRDQHRLCYMELQPCITADMKFFKDFIAEAIVMKCNRCTKKQKILLEIIADWFTTNKPKEWDEFINKILENLRKKNSRQQPPRNNDMDK